MNLLQIVHILSIGSWTYTLDGIGADTRYWYRCIPSFEKRCLLLHTASQMAEGCLFPHMRPSKSPNIGHIFLLLNLTEKHVLKVGLFF